MQDRIAQETEGHRRGLRVVGATAACVVALAVACSPPIADQTAAPKANDVSVTATREVGPSSLDHMPVYGQQPVNVDQPYFEFQVDKQVRTVPDSPQPHYPPAMKKAKVSGEVLAQFVVNTDGRANMNTFKVLKTDHQEFADAGKATLPDMRFYPAEIRGTKVMQMVQQPFTFAISK